MPTFSQLRDYVVATVNEPSVEESEVDLLLNEAMEVVAAEILLPELDTAATVITAVVASAVDLPADYGRGLYKVTISEQATAPTVLTTRGQLLDRYPDFQDGDLLGEVAHVCVVAGELIYYPIPESPVTMTLYYYRHPTALVSDSQIPECIPVAFQRKLLANYAIKELWDPIEDGMEGQKVNTARYEQKFTEALAALDASISQGRSTPAPPRDRKGFA